MKTVMLTEVLDYYDGIQIFAARDPIGGHYLCEMVDTAGDFDRYAVVGVRPERLSDFRAGRVDLRTLLLEPPGGEWYITVADGTIDDPLTLEPQRQPLAETDYLPDEGFFLEEPAPTSDMEVQQALASNKVVVVTGRFEQVNQSTGEWGLLTEHEVRTGKIDHPEAIRQRASEPNRPEETPRAPDPPTRAFCNAPKEPDAERATPKNRAPVLPRQQMDPEFLPPQHTGASRNHFHCSI